MTWARGMGASACAIAVQFCRAADESAAATGSGAAAGESAAAGAPEAADAVGALLAQAKAHDVTTAKATPTATTTTTTTATATATATATTTIVDPFCGVGTVLCVANEMGCDAVGVEISAKRCAAAARLRLLRKEDAPGWCATLAQASA